MSDAAFHAVPRATWSGEAMNDPLRPLGATAWFQASILSQVPQRSQDAAPMACNPIKNNQRLSAAIDTEGMNANPRYGTQHGDPRGLATQMAPMTRAHGGTIRGTHVHPTASPLLAPTGSFFHC